MAILVGIVACPTAGAVLSRDADDRTDVVATGVAERVHREQESPVETGEKVAQCDELLAANVEAWRVELTLLCWLPGLDGTVGVRGQTSTAHSSFIDIVDSSDSLFGYSGRIEVGRGRWSMFLDGLYNQVTDENASGPLGVANIDVTFEETLLDFGAIYRVVGSHAVSHAASHAVSLDTSSVSQASAAFHASDTSVDLYVGGRLTSLRLELDPALLLSRSDDRTWVDPIVGARLGVPLDAVLGGPFRLSINGDMGGFGVASDFTWSATAVIAFDFTAWGTPASVFVGYRAVGWDYSDGTDAAAFTWDVIQHGALFGFAVRF